MITPEFQVHYRRHLPRAPDINANTVSPGEELPGRKSEEFTEKQTMDFLPKKRLTPEVVAMLLSKDLGGDTSDAQYRTNNILPEGNDAKVCTKTAPGDNSALSSSDFERNCQNNIGIVEIVKSSGQPLGFSVREGYGSETEKAGGIFVSRLTPGGIVEQQSLLRAGDEILEINRVPVHGYKLSDVVAMIQIPKRLALRVRFRGKHWHGHSNTTPFAGNDVLPVNNNNIYRIGDAGKSARSGNKGTGVTDENTWATESKLETNGTAFPRSLNFRRSSSGRLLPLRPDSEAEKLRHSTSKHKESSNLNAVKPKTVPGHDTLSFEVSEVKDTSGKLSNEKPGSGNGSRKTSAVLPVSTTEANRNTRVKDKYNNGSEQNRVPGFFVDGIYRETGGVGSIFHRSYQENVGTGQSKRVDPGDIRFDIVSTNVSASNVGVSSCTIEEEKSVCEQDNTPTSSPLGLRKKSAAEIFSSSSSLSSSDSPKSQTRRPLQVTRLSLSEMSTHCSRSADASPVSSSAEGEEQMSNAVQDNRARRHTEHTPPLLLHSHSSDELNHSHSSWFSKIGNQRRKHVRKFSEGVQLRTPPKGSGEAYRLQEPTDSSSDDLDPGYRLYPSNVSRSGRTESKNTCRAVTGMLTLEVVKIRCKISPEEAIPKDKRKKFKIFCTVDSDGLRQACTGAKKCSGDCHWNESFEMEVQRAREIKITVWMRSKKDGDRTLAQSCLYLAQLLSEGSEHMLAVCLIPSGVLYVKLHFTDMKVLLQRTPSQKNEGVFGFPLETVLRRENSTIPMILQKCVEEINSRGLEFTGIYRLCGNAAKKRTLRAQFDNCSANVDLGREENPVDVNIITGLLKDYLRELPHPLLSQEVRDILCEASAERAPCHSNGQALVDKITEQFPVSSKATITYLLDHFATVLMNSDLNKMDSHNLAVCIGPVLLCPSLDIASSNAVSDTKKDINAIKLLLEIWPKPEQVSAC